MIDVVYWDTSALVKLYAAEPDSAGYLQLFAGQTEEIAISFLHRVELFYSLRNKEARAEISVGSAAGLFELFEEHARQGRYLEIPWGDDVANEARRLLVSCLAGAGRLHLRTLDGLHLGAVMAAGIGRLVTADARLSLAARAIGLVTLEP